MKEYISKIILFNEIVHDILPTENLNFTQIFKRLHLFNRDESQKNDREKSDYLDVRNLQFKFISQRITPYVLNQNNMKDRARVIFNDKFPSVQNPEINIPIINKSNNPSTIPNVSLEPS